jgi:hypothetical protein
MRPRPGDASRIRGWLSAHDGVVCYSAGVERPTWRELELHREPQDIECDAWKRLVDHVERAAVNGTLRFQPRPEMTKEQ